MKKNTDLPGRLCRSVFCHCEKTVRKSAEKEGFLLALSVRGCSPGPITRPCGIGLCEVGHHSGSLQERKLCLLVTWK